MARSMLRRLVTVLAALALAPAGAIAQGAANRPVPPGAQPPKTPPATTQPAPAAQQAPAGQPQGTAQSLTEDMKRMLNELHHRNVGESEAAKIATQQASSPEIKALAQKIWNDRAQMSKELEALAKQRGLPAFSAASSGEAQASSQVLARLKGLHGADFDRAYVQEVIRDHEQDEATLKKMRDQTPGKDAELKSTLDRLENVVEEDLTATRNAKKNLDAQRQARKPGP
jgi:putative membrane protein